MANEIVLMEKDQATMNVPAAKAAEYLAQGWKEISRTVIAAEVKQPAVKAEMPVPGDLPAIERGTGGDKALKAVKGKKSEK